VRADDADLDHAIAEFGAGAGCFDIDEGEGDWLEKGDAMGQGRIPNRAVGRHGGAFCGEGRYTRMNHADN
jgi:hypothetical protein